MHLYFVVIKQEMPYIIYSKPKVLFESLAELKIWHNSM